MSLIKNNPNTINVITTISTVAIAVISVFITIFIFNLQNHEEYIRNRAYLSMTSVQENLFIGHNGGNGLNLKIQLKNSGNTPAKDIKQSSHFSIDSEKIDYYESKPTILLNPKESVAVNIDLKVDKAGLFKEYSGNYVVVEIKYSDYKNKEHLVRIHMTVDFDGNEYYVGLNKQEEIEL